MMLILGIPTSQGISSIYYTVQDVIFGNDFFPVRQHFKMSTAAFTTDYLLFVFGIIFF